MMKISKKLVLICSFALLLPTISNASITRLTSYADLLSALKNGHRVSVVSDSSKCKVTDFDKHPPTTANAYNPSLTAVLGLNFNTDFFLTYQDPSDPRTYIVTIATNTIAGTEDGAYYRYKRIKVYDDNSVEVYASQSEFKSGRLLGGMKAVCAISNGHDANGASLFDYDGDSQA